MGRTTGRAEVVRAALDSIAFQVTDVLKAMEQAPVWQPATCNGLPVESGGVLRIELPEGKTLPHETELILR